MIAREAAVYVRGACRGVTDKDVSVAVTKMAMAGGTIRRLWGTMAP
jgi:hypothetical protein